MSTPTATGAAAPTITLALKPTTTPTPTAAPAAQLAARLAAVLHSERWPVAGLDPAQAAAWEAYAGGAELAGNNLEGLQTFLNQWEVLSKAADQALIPRDARVQFKVADSIQADGQPAPVLYAVDGQEQDAGNERIFLIARDEDENPIGLALAPEIQDLVQQISPDGRYVDYVDRAKKHVLLRADARKLTGNGPAEDVLKKRLDEVYRKSSPFVRAGLYPRFFFPIQGVDAAFFLLDESLTYQQILQMNEAFALFDRPNLLPLKSAMFGSNVAVVVVEQMDLAAGLTYSGTGVIELDRRDLFGNKYYLAEVLAHEGSHVLQGPMTGKGGCKQVLKREVADQTIPKGFLAWTADQLLDGVREHTIGAYHVSMWILNQVGLRGREVDLLRQVIQTGQVNGISVTPFCK